MSSQRLLMMILDGFGIRQNQEYNAVLNANMPFYKKFAQENPHAQIMTHGKWAGLPDGIMGNSEVGHLTIGSGRIIYQALMRISVEIENGKFFKNDTLLRAIRGSSTGTVHLMGLLSDAGVHSDIAHLKALLDLCAKEKIPHVSVHAFLDGRDTPPDSAGKYIRDLLSHPSFKNGTARLVSMMGRYYAMDRDKRWDRTERAYDAMCGKIPETQVEPLAALKADYAKNPKGDEFVEPVLFYKDGAMKDGDSVIFYNYRADRARQITDVIALQKKNFKPAHYACMMEYDSKFGLPVAYPPMQHKNILGEVVSQKGLKQLRIAETEKYAHVTFFFNGGEEEPFPGEERVLIDSPRDVATYDLKPEMSAPLVAQRLAKELASEKYDFVLVNFANPDMIGHTGVYPAAIESMEKLDRCLDQVISAARKHGYHVLLSADHGNIEEMRDSEGRPHTQHTLNPVPVIYASPLLSPGQQNHWTKLRDGGLQDLMPTACEIMGLKIPREVTGHSLLERES